LHHRFHAGPADVPGPRITLTRSWAGTRSSISSRSSPIAWGSTQGGRRSTISVAVANIGRGGEVRHIGTIENTPTTIGKLVRSLARRHGVVEFVCEAGSCGYNVRRPLAAMGLTCRVCAPSLTPRKPGARIKNDRHDAIALARLHRAGELTYIWVPDALHETLRDLVQARHSACQDQSAVHASGPAGRVPDLPRRARARPGLERSKSKHRSATCWRVRLGRSKCKLCRRSRASVRWWRRSSPRSATSPASPISGRYRRYRPRAAWIRLAHRPARPARLLTHTSDDPHQRERRAR
jgi:Transposase